MRYLKVTITTNPGSTQLIYPLNYETEVGVYAIDHLYYKEGFADRLLLTIPDARWNPNMIRPGIEEITEATLNAISEANEPDREYIVDEAQLRRLELKARVTNLTGPELAIVTADPSSPGALIQRVPKLKDRNAKAKLLE